MIWSNIKSVGFSDLVNEWVGRDILKKGFCGSRKELFYKHVRMLQERDKE